MDLAPSTTVYKIPLLKALKPEFFATAYGNEIRKLFFTESSSICFFPRVTSRGLNVVEIFSTLDHAQLIYLYYALSPPTSVSAEAGEPYLIQPVRPSGCLYPSMQREGS